MSALENFFVQIGKIYPVSNALRETLEKDTEVCGLSKNDLILREGERCDHVSMVVSGLLRVYYQKEGQEISSRFIREHDVVLSVGSFYSRTPGYEFIQALEETTIVRLHYDQLQRLYKEHLEFNFIGRVLTEHYYALSEQRLYLLRKQTAEERYRFFMDQYADLLQRVPLKYIATFLGMNLETLSRIRKKMSEG